MIKYLMHKDTVVAVIDCNDFYIKDIEVRNKKLMPFDVTVNPKQFNRDYNEWRKQRCIPCSAQQFTETSAFTLGTTSCDISNIVQASVNDCYWLKPQTLGHVKWDDINYYKNKMYDVSKFIQLTDENFKKYYNITEKLDKYALENPHTPKSIKYFTLNDDGKYCIVKNENIYSNSQDIYNELIGNILCDYLDIPHAEYYIVPYNIVYNREILQIPLIACELCIQDENLEALTADNIIRAGIVSKHELYGDFVNRGFGDFINKMLTLDFLLMNPSRDLTNFGYIRNSTTLEIVDVMPIFDCGASFNYTKARKFTDNYKIDYSMPFRMRHCEQINLVNSFTWLDLNDIYDAIPEIEAVLTYSPIPDERQEEILNILIERIHLLEEHIRIKGFRTKNSQIISDYRKTENIKRRFDVEKIKEINGFDPTKECDINKIFFSFLTPIGKEEFNNFEVFNSNLKERFEHFKNETFGIIP